MNDELLSMECKTLLINLDPAEYESFAMIGAGQEGWQTRLSQTASSIKESKRI